MSARWTDKCDALLTELWEGDRPVPQITALLGVSRATVYGKADQLGLKKRSKAAPVRKPSIEWPEAKIKRLKQIWGTCFIAQIAGELGVSRNAVIGKAHRLGLERLKVPGAKGDKHPGWRGGRGASLERAKHKSRLAGVARRAQFKALAATPPCEQPAAIPVAQRASLLDLTMDRCHWPVGDPAFQSFDCSENFFFCGGRVFAGYPYCRGHCLIAYTPAAKPTPLFPSQKGRKVG